MKPAKTTIALTVFTVIEAWALSHLIATGFKAAKIVPLFPNDLVLNLVVFLIAGGIGYFIGKLVIKKWQARAWVKAVMASLTIIATWFAAYYITTIYYRMVFEEYLRNYKGN